MKKKILFISNTDWFMYNFNSRLLSELRRRGYEISVSFPEGRYGNYFSKRNYPLYYIRLSRGLDNPLKLLRSLRYLLLVVRKDDPDIIVGFTFKAVICLALLEPLLRGRGKLLVLPGFGRLFVDTSRKMQVIRYFCVLLLKVILQNRKNKLLVLNNSDHDELKQILRLPDERLQVLSGHGVSPEEFPFVEKTPRVGNVIRVVMPARVRIDKGVNEFLMAAKLVRKLDPKRFVFIIAGSFDEEFMEMKKAAWIDVCKESGVAWIGHSENMNEVYDESDIVVLPSYREGLPTVILEAGLKKIPVIVTDVPGCNDIVTHNEDGLVVPKCNPQALATAIMSLSCDEKRKGLAAALHCKILGKYTVEKVTDQFEVLLDESI